MGSQFVQEYCSCAEGSIIKEVAIFGIEAERVDISPYFGKNSVFIEGSSLL